MKIFVTGASGFIGSAIAAELIKAGHSVLGLARNDAAAAKVRALGATPFTGDVEDAASLKTGAAQTDGVVHCGFVHDFARFREVCEIDRKAILAFGEALAGTQKPLLVASGVAVPTGKPGLITEDIRSDVSPDQMPRVLTERTLDEIVAKGIRGGAMRFPPTVHGPHDHGFITMLGDIAKQKGVAGYIDEGTNRWPAVNRLDAGVAGALAIASDFVGGTRFHVVGEEGIPFRQIAEAIGKKLGLPAQSIPKDKAAEHFGWFAHFAGANVAASSERTRAFLKWTPTHADLLPDIAASYF
ncbi:MAG TPA: SDR family oxidoreductase [Kofleriaceae bacterium]|jgi:nucleoside-diphosphate-sugar epimerase